MEKKWLGTPEVAAELGLSQRSVYAIVNRGELVAYRLGRVYRVRRADLDAYLESARLAPGDLGHLLPPPGDEEADGGEAA